MSVYSREDLDVGELHLGTYAPSLLSMLQVPLIAIHATDCSLLRSLSLVARSECWFYFLGRFLYVVATIDAFLMNGLMVIDMLAYRLGTLPG
jgi:hypothetical protein